MSYTWDRNKSAVHLPTSSTHPSPQPPSQTHGNIQRLNPLLKKPSAYPSKLKNFYPILLRPFSAEVLEKAINHQLAKHPEENSLPDRSQSGFRSNHTTKIALIATTNIRSLLFHLSAAFNTVSHHIRIWGYTLKWITSSPTGHMQRIHLPPFTSEPKSIICSFQVSSLSPTLLNAFMTQLADSLYPRTQHPLIH